MKRFLMMILTLSVSVSTLGQTARTSVNKTMDRVKHPKDFQVIEFRKRKGERRRVERSANPPTLPQQFCEIDCR
jgi:hypothetical protein